MRGKYKKPTQDLRNYYTVFLQLGIVAVLLIFIVAMKVEFVAEKPNTDLTEEQEVTKMEDIIQTKQEETPPTPPRPQVPVEVPNDEIIEDQSIDLDAEMSLDEPLDMPPPPEEEDDEEKLFVIVEEMPKMKGGQEWLYNNIEYPEMARKAGIEGRVIIQFIVNKKGKAQNLKILRSLGGGCDEAAKKVLRDAEFSIGRQRGRPVKVKMSQSIVFRLQN
ncbi:energy transducer TonB [Fodinibius halophilus]|uniref:Energy transducer TonB n=1 Tax=Fodinibius halophilus TaxID=1736908 RepID=A0A6M1T2Y8_9BACT|nr:energy transducer TonB [Fodinibius halophilus]NGP88409.1 energy transducer TonB [Fodinibius halophilus]